MKGDDNNTRKVSQRIDKKLEDRIDDSENEEDDFHETSYERGGGRHNKEVEGVYWRVEGVINTMLTW